MTRTAWLLTLGTGLALAPPAFAVTIDGTADPAYGAPLSVQAIQTSFGDQTYPYDDLVTHARASELDQAFGFIAGDVLYLFLAGNVRGDFASEWYPQDQLHVFIDARPGGQNALRADQWPTTASCRRAGAAPATFSAARRPADPARSRAAPIRTASKPP
jgi:hypothetical protein